MCSSRDSKFILFRLKPQAYSWRGLNLLGLIYFGALFFAALAAPPVYWLVGWWAEIAPNELNTYLAEKTFEDYFDRLRWIPVLILLFWLLKACGVNSWRRLGIDSKRESRRIFCVWFGIGFILMTLTALAQVFGTEVSLRETNLSIENLIGTILKSLAGGLILGLLEEIVFRGLIFRIFYTAFRPGWAVGLSAAFFAYTHFKMPNFIWEQTDQVVDWSSGFFVAYWTVLGITQDFEWLPFLNLFMLGVILTLLFMGTRSLVPCVGLHAGLVTLMLSYQKMFKVTEGTPSWLWGSDAITDSLLALVLLIALSAGLAVAVFFCQKERNAYHKQKP